MSTLLSIAWDPELRGIMAPLVGFIMLCGSVYLLLGTNVGVRLGFLVALAGLAGWIMSMGIIWWSYGIGLKGTAPSWKPSKPFGIVRDGTLLIDANVLDEPVKVAADASFPDIAKATAADLEASGWKLLPTDDQGRGQAIASADEIIQVEAEMYAAGDYEAVAVYDKGGERYPKFAGDKIDFIAFFHKPHYAIVEIAPLVPQRSEPGRAPARNVIDTTKPHQYVLMTRDLGTKRQPAMFITLGSGIIFLLSCWMLHRRDRVVALNRSGRAVPAKA